MPNSKAKPGASGLNKGDGSKPSGITPLGLVESFVTKTGQAERGNTTLMAWERRDRGGLYYTRSKKVNGRVEREYIGGGVFAEIAALLDAEKRRRREIGAAVWREERADMEDLDSRVEEFCEGVEDIACAALLVAGFRKHKRGEWRRKRESKETARRDGGRKAER